MRSDSDLPRKLRACLELSCRGGGALLEAMSDRARATVLHYTGYDDDRGGIMSVIGALAAENAFDSVLGVNTGFQARRLTGLPVLELPRIEGERLGWRTWLQARRVASRVQAWLAGDPRRVFHGHSRAGLAVALRLAALGERRVLATVHCYGRQRWYYRHAARKLREGLHWLSPAMKRYYGVAVEARDPWRNCLPGCVRVPGGAAAGRPTGATTGDVVRLAGVGTLTRWKRWHLVVEALATLPAERRAKFVFRHIGGTDGSADSRAYGDELRRSTTERGLADVIEWRGEQAGADALLAESDALVVVSALEPLSVAMLEALFAGVPVLAAAAGGALDVIAPPVNGWLFRGSDPVELARALEKLADPARRAAVRVEREGLQRFTAAAAAVRHAEIYRRLTT